VIPHQRDTQGVSHTINRLASSLHASLRRLSAAGNVYHPSFEVQHMGDVVQRMAVPDSYKHFIRSRYLAIRNVNVAAGDWNHRMYRTIGLLKTLTGVMVRG